MPIFVERPNASCVLACPKERGLQAPSGCRNVRNPRRSERTGALQDAVAPDMESRFMRPMRRQKKKEAFRDAVPDAQATRVASPHATGHHNPAFSRTTHNFGMHHFKTKTAQRILRRFYRIEKLMPLWTNGYDGDRPQNLRGLNPR